MKAIIQPKYGSPDILRLEEVEKPTPRDGEVLVKVHSISLNGSDWESLRGRPLYARLGGLRKPGNGILGSDISGWVEAVGSGVTQFQAGDEVFGELAEYRGGLAEYARTSENLLAHKPDGMTFEQAAALPQAAVIALQGIVEQGQVRPGQEILINGAGGSAGMYAIQLAKLHGAAVTGVDNAFKLDFMRSLGAHHVIDYTRENFTKNGKQYDLILDLIAHHSAFAYQRALRPGGNYFLVGGAVPVMLQVLLLGPWIRRRSGRSLQILMVRRGRQALQSVIELFEAGKIRPLIDRAYPLQQAPEALLYMGEGRARGKVIITVGQANRF